MVEETTERENMVGNSREEEEEEEVDEAVGWVEKLRKGRYSDTSVDVIDDVEEMGGE